MRDIRFRGKRLDNGEWVEGAVEFHLTDGDLTKRKRNAFITSDTMDRIGQVYRDTFSVDPSTVGQWTGLQDKNGVDIYEGDVLCGDYGDITYQNEVFFADDGYALRHNHNEYGCCALLTEHENLERIGNIHDNPELIKEA